MLPFTGFPAQAQSTPAGVVSAFMDAWNTQDFEGMYRYVHPNTQQLYPLEVFRARYQAAHEVILFEGVAYTITGTRLQGQSAMVTYDASITSGSFETIEDEGRIMRLMNTPNGWRIAWTGMDIFDTMAGDAALRVQTVPQQRGNIYDRNGELLAWDGGTTSAIYTSTGQMSDFDDCTTLVAQIARVSQLDIENRAANRTADNVFWVTEMDTNTYTRNRDRLQEICGVNPDTQVFTSGPHRMYYGGTALSHVVGYIGPIPQEQLAEYQARGYGAGDLVGLYGAEQTYQDVLAGRPERVLQVVDSAGTVLNEITRTEGQPSNSVTLTLDRDIQLSTVQAISDAFNYARGNWGSPTVSSGGAVVVLDVETSEVLSLASYPLVDPFLFNPNATSIENRGILLQQMITDPRGPIRNRATNEQLSPGSVFKIITAAAVLNEGLVQPEDQFNCDLFWYGQEFGDTTEVRQDWRVVDDLEAAGIITPAEAIMSSCNPFFWQYGAILYNRNQSGLVNYARRLGLGQIYNLGIVPETSGVINIPAGTDAAINEAVGQGDVSIPPIQMAVATATVANGGTLRTPTLVRQVGGVGGLPLIAETQPPEPQATGLTSQVIAAIQEGMCGVTTNEDLGTAYIRFGDPTEEYHVMADYSVCGKTGTAQTGLFPNAWFIAYAPADDPQLAMVVMVEQSLEGSQIAAPIARRIFDDYFNTTQRAAFPIWWNNEPYIPLDIPEGGGSR